MALTGKLHIVTVHVTNFDRALEFYRDKLGMTVIQSFKDENFAMFDTGGTPLGIHVPTPDEEGRSPGGVTGMIFEVEDIKKAVDEMKKKGVKIVYGPEKAEWGPMIAGFEDPDGNEYMLTQHSK